MMNTADELDLFKADGIDFWIIVSRPEEEVIECFQGDELPHIVLINDIEDRYRTINSLNGYDDMYTTFLLDKNNKVRVVGDLMKNLNVRGLYIREIQKMQKK